MNYNLHNNFRKSFLSIEMTEAEKNVMKKNLHALILGTEIPVHTTIHPLRSFNYYLQRTVTFGAMGMLVLGILSQPASASSLPGEILYPVKLAHEEIVSATKINIESKVSYETKRTEKRIKEATKLIEKNEFSKENQKTLSESIEKHNKRIQENIAKVTEQDPLIALELSTQAGDTIEKNINELKKVIAQASDTESSLAAIQKPVEEPVSVMNTLLPLDNNAHSGEIIPVVFSDDLENTIPVTVSNYSTENIILSSANSEGELSQNTKEFKDILINKLESDLTDITTNNEVLLSHMVDTIITPNESESHTTVIEKNSQKKF